MYKTKVIWASSPTDLEDKLNKAMASMDEVVNVSVSGNTATILYLDKPKTLNEVKNRV